MSKVLLFNPKSAENKYRIPNSILNIAASIEGKYEWIIVDGNCEADPAQKIERYLSTGEVKYLGFTVMPGPQLKQAITISKFVKQKFPNTIMIWGGYFPSNQPNSVLFSGYVDFIINGPGDHAFPQLIDALETGASHLSLLKI
jgi:anaerobic magnesium-protoporphyrin IX monomethyl ester cyclase